MFVVFRPARLSVIVARPVSTKEQQFRFARRIGSNRLGENLPWIFEIGPVTTEAMSRLDDSDGLRCNRVGNIQRLIGRSTIDTQVEQAESGWAMTWRPVFATLKDRPRTERPLDPTELFVKFKYIFIRSFVEVTWQFRPFQFMSGDRTRCDWLVTEKSWVSQGSQEFFFRVPIVCVDETVNVSREKLYRIAIKSGGWIKERVPKQPFQWKSIAKDRVGGWLS